MTTKCKICNRGLVPIKNDYDGRKYHNNCYKRAGKEEFKNDEERKACAKKILDRFTYMSDETLDNWGEVINYIRSQT
jgi:hypothetical protein